MLGASSLMLIFVQLTLVLKALRHLFSSFFLHIVLFTPHADFATINEKSVLEIKCLLPAYCTVCPPFHANFSCFVVLTVSNWF